MAIVAVVNTKGGVGKTTVALNLAHYLKVDNLIDNDKHYGITNLICCAEEQDFHEVVNTLSVEDVYEAAKLKGLTLIDCGGYDELETRAAIAVADVVLVPTSADPTDLFALNNFDNVISAVSRDHGKPIRAIVVLNRVNPSRRDFSAFQAQISVLKNFELCPMMIPASATLPKAAFKGAAVKSGTVGAKFSYLARYIKDRLKK